MASDYYKMGLSLGSAYHEGMEDDRLRKRQISEDERLKLMREREDATYDRALGIQRDIDRALEAQRVLTQQGSYTGNTAGMSDAAGRALYQSGGQALVDTTARLGNEEDARYGLQPAPGNPYAGAQYQAEAHQFGAPRIAPPPRYAVSGLNTPTVQTNKATDREIYNSDVAVAAASRNPAAIAGLRARGKQLDINDTIQSNIARAKTDPEYRQTLFAQVNQNSKNFTVVAATATTPTQISWVDAKGVGQSKPLSETQVNQVISGLAHIQHGEVPKGLNELAAVDERFRAVAAEEMRTNLDVAKVNNDAASHFATALNQKANIAELVRHHTVTEATNKDAKASASALYDMQKTQIEGVVADKAALSKLDKEGREAGKVFTDQIAKKDNAYWAKNPGEHQMLLEKAGMAYAGKVGNYLQFLQAQQKGVAGGEKQVSDLHKTQLASVMTVLKENPELYPVGSAKLYNLFRQAGLSEQFIEKELGHPNVDGRNARAVKLNMAQPFVAGTTQDKLVDGQVYSRGKDQWKWNADTKKMDPHTPSR